MTNRASTPRSLARPALVALLLAGLLLALAGAAVAKKAEIPDDLPTQYKQFLERVELLITDAEREAFLTLEADYQRDAFIQRFWRIRDKNPETARNEFREQWEAMYARVAADYDGAFDARGRMLLLNGPPASIIEASCPGRLFPVEIWYYARSWAIGEEFVLIFYRPHGGGAFRLWHPAEGLNALLDDSGPGKEGGLRDVALTCRDGDKVAGAVAWVLRQGVMGFDTFIARMESARDEPSQRVGLHLRRLLDPGAGGRRHLRRSVDVTFPGRRQSRTVTQGLITVPTEGVGTAELAGNRSYNFLLNGEVLRGGELFESFRYKFDFPASQVPG